MPDIEYTPRNELQPLEDLPNELLLAFDQCEASEWTVVCSGLLLLRRLVVHHKEAGWDHMYATPSKHLLLCAFEQHLRSKQKGLF